MIEAAIDLMRAHGLSGSAINDVVLQSGAPRGSLYHHFPGGKLQMAREALAVHGSRIQLFIDQALESAPEGPGQVIALFEAFAQRVEQAEFRKSCPFGCVALDLDEDTESLREVVVQSFTSWQESIAAHFRWLGPEQAAEFASLLLTGIEGAYIRARAEHSSKAFSEVGRWMSKLIQ